MNDDQRTCGKRSRDRVQKGRTTPVNARLQCLAGTWVHHFAKQMFKYRLHAFIIRHLTGKSDQLNSPDPRRYNADKMARNSGSILVVSCLT